MRKNLTQLLFAFAVIILFYPACKKESKPSAATLTKTTVDYKALSSQVATAFYKSITGQYGGNDVRKGVNAPANLQSPGHGQLVLNDITPMCGTVVDTTTSSTTGTNPFTGTVTTFFENLHLVYTCDANQINGYTIRDSVISVANSQLFLYHTNSVTQDYSVKALDQTYKIVSMNGSLGALDEVQNIEAPTIKSTASIYNLTGLTVDFTSGSGDVKSGTSTFVTTTTDFGPQTNFISNIVKYTGTIVFLGNNMARLTIDPGMVYMVNLLTGVVTPV